MLKAVFIDLDNTIALFDEILFFDRFFNLLYTHFDDLFTLEDLQNRVITATLSLGQNKEGKLNRDCFLDSISDREKIGSKEFWQRSMDFYENDFDKAQPDVTKPGKLRMVLDELKQMGLRLIVATNPIYPKIAMEKRLAWVDVEPETFELITHMENMSFVKPQADYYRQICNLLNIAPEHCLMVGNDPRNDMAAAEINIKTYLAVEGGTTDYSSLSLQEAQEKDTSQAYKPNFSGPLAGLIDVVRELQ